MEPCMIQPVIHNGNRLTSAVEPPEVGRHLPGNRGQAGLLPPIDPALQRNDEAVVEPPMKEPQPRGGRVAAKPQLFPHAFEKLRKHDVHGDQRRVQTVDPRRVYKLCAQAAEGSVPPPPKMVGDKPPEIRREMGPGQCRNAMPYDTGQVHAFHAHAVEVNLKFPGEPLDLLGHATLRPVLLVQEWRDDHNARLKVHGWESAHAPPNSLP